MFESAIGLWPISSRVPQLALRQTQPVIENALHVDGVFIFLPLCLGLFLLILKFGPDGWR
jgi:hypothetical protein